MNFKNFRRMPVSIAEVRPFKVLSPDARLLKKSSAQGSGREENKVAIYSSFLIHGETDLQIRDFELIMCSIHVCFRSMEKIIVKVYDRDRIHAPDKKAGICKTSDNRFIVVGGEKCHA